MNQVEPLTGQLSFSVKQDVFMSLLYLASITTHLNLCLFLYSEVDSFSGRICLIFLLFPFIFATGFFFLFVRDVLNRIKGDTYEDALSVERIERSFSCFRTRTLMAIFIVYPLWQLAYIC